MKLEKKEKTADSSSQIEIVIDYPQEGEEIIAADFSVRISAPENVEVQVSIDKGSWRACRASVGHYWYDWRPAKLGQHLLKARIYQDKRWRESEQRACKVIEI